MASIILNGKRIPEEKACISPVNRGMMYGDGCFETFRIYSGRFFRWKAHADRLISGLQYLDMQAPFDTETLKKQVRQVLAANTSRERDAMVRLQCWRKGGRGYAPDTQQLNWMIQASEIDKETNAHRLITAKTRCIPSESLERRYKFSNGLNYIKAVQEARNIGVDDALMLTTDEWVSETTSANIFWVKGGQAFTPDDTCDLLPGVTRAAVLDVLKQRNIPVKTGTYTLDEIMKAEAIFCTNSVAEIRDIEGLDGKEFKVDHPLVKAIKAGFEKLKNKELQE